MDRIRPPGSPMPRYRLLVLGMAALLGACAETSQFLQLPPVPSFFWRPPTDMDLLARSWAKPQPSLAVPPVYCYATLGDRDCYSEPQPNWAARQVGTIGRVAP